MEAASETLMMCAGSGCLRLNWKSLKRYPDRVMRIVTRYE